MYAFILTHSVKSFDNQTGLCCCRNYFTAKHDCVLSHVGVLPYDLPQKTTSLVEVKLIAFTDTRTPTLKALTKMSIEVRKQLPSFDHISDDSFEFSDTRSTS